MGGTKTPQKKLEEAAESLQTVDVDQVLRKHNLNLPGMPPNFVDIPKELSVPEVEPSKVSYSLLVSGEETAPSRNIWQVVFLNQDSFPYECDLEMFATCGGTKVTVYELTSQHLVKLLQNYQVNNDQEDLYCLCWGTLECGRLFKPVLAVGGNLGVICVFDLETSETLSTLYGHLNSIHELKFMPSDGQFLLSASEDFTVRLWNVAKSVQVAIFNGLEGHKQGVLTLDWHLTEQVFLSGSRDSSVKIWKVSNKVQQRMNLSKNFDCKFKKNNEGLDCATNPFPTLQVFEAEFSTSKVHNSYVDCARFFGNLIISKAQGGQLVVWKPFPEIFPDSVSVLYTLNYPDLSMEVGIRFSVFAGKNCLLAVGGDNSNVFVFSLKSQEVEPVEVKLSQTKSLVRDLSFSKNSNSLVVVSDCSVSVLQRVDN